MASIGQDQLKDFINDYYSSYFQMDGIYNEWALANKIQDTTLFVLDEISKQEPTSQSSLKRRLGYSKQTISSSLRRLEKEGIIVRRRSKDDQRNNLIYLTKQGKEYAQPLLARLHEAERRAFQTLGEDECRVVLDAFHRLTSALASSTYQNIEENSAGEKAVSGEL